MRRRWVHVAIAIAFWPLAMTLGVVVLSPPVFALYEQGILGASPVAPMAFISTGAAALSTMACAVIWGIVRATSSSRQRQSSRRAEEA